MTRRLIVVIGSSGIVFPAFPLFRRFQYGQPTDFAFVIDFADPKDYGA